MASTTITTSVLDTKRIIAQSLKVQRNIDPDMRYLSIRRLQNIILYICNALIRNEEQYNYRICANFDRDAIEMAVICNRGIFELDEDAGLIYLNDEIDLNKLCKSKQYSVETVVYDLIDSFEKKYKSMVF